MKAMEYLRADFNDPEAIGPRRVAEFLYGRPDAAVQADAVGFHGNNLSASLFTFGGHILEYRSALLPSGGKVMLQHAGFGGGFRFLQLFGAGRKR
jgi:hypothetical protein